MRSTIASSRGLPRAISPRSRRSGSPASPRLLEDAEWPARLARHLADLVRRTMAAPGDKDLRLRVVEQLVDALRAPDGLDDQLAPDVPRILRTVQRVWRIAARGGAVRPVSRRWS